jgi:hypothetical protein
LVKGLQILNAHFAPHDCLELPEVTRASCVSRVIDENNVQKLFQGIGFLPGGESRYRGIDGRGKWYLYRHGDT